MKKYSVYGSVTGSVYMGVYEADSTQDAIDKANAEFDGGNFCHQCSELCEDPQYEAVGAEEE